MFTGSNRVDVLQRLHSIRCNVRTALPAIVREGHLQRAGRMHLQQGVPHVKRGIVRTGMHEWLRQRHLRRS